MNGEIQTLIRETIIAYQIQKQIHQNKTYIYIYIIKGVTPAGTTQRYYIAGESGKEKRQENTEK